MPDGLRNMLRSGERTSPQPLPSDQKRAVDEARNAGADAAERLYVAGREEDIIILKRGKDGRIYVKDYGRIIA